MKRSDLETLPKDNLLDLILVLFEQAEQLKREVAALKKDSQTSSKPPSSDLPSASKKRRSLRQSSSRKPGGQKGHSGHQQKLVETPDTIVAHSPCFCESCHQSLELKPGQVLSRRQVRDIPPVQVTVTEHQKMGKRCDCGHWNTGVFPTDVNAPIQIGPRARAFLFYLNIVHLLPYKRLSQLTADLFGCPISEGSIDNILNGFDQKAKPLMPTLLNIVKQSHWVGSDETGLKVDARRWWLWVWQSMKATYYIVNPGRGYQVVKDHFGEDYKGCLVHDCWSAQNNTLAKRGHQQCHPHLIRDLNFVIDTEHSQWAYKMKQFLLASQKARDHIWQPGFMDVMRQKVISDYQNRLMCLTNQQLTKPEERRMQKRIRKHQKAIFLFMTDPSIPFHNNDSEKAIRNAKVKQKVSGAFRTPTGAHRYARLLSIVESCKKQKMDILTAIQNLANNQLSFQNS